MTTISSTHTLVRALVLLDGKHSAITAQRLFNHIDGCTAVFRLSALACLIGMLHCLSVPTSSWMTCIGRPCLSRSSPVAFSWVTYTFMASSGAGSLLLLLSGCCTPRVCGPVLGDGTEHLLCLPIINENDH